MRVAIIGAGPAGLSLAYFLKRGGIEAEVFESLNRPGLKPCAWGLITGIEDLVPLRKESIISEIKGFRIYLNGKLVFDVRGDRKLGYIIDKPRFLEDIASEVEVRYNSHVIKRGGEYRLQDGSPLKGYDRVIEATGHYSLGKEHAIPAIQYITDYQQDPEIVEFYFYSGLLGYAWVFPDRNGAKIGIGGWTTVDTLKELVKGVLKGRVLSFHGARVADVGIIEERLKQGNYIGEALGTVLPLTGEGIRPSILSAWAMAEAIKEGKTFEKVFKSMKIYSAIQYQAKIIKGVKEGKISTGGLSRVLTSSDPDLVFKIAIGEFGKLDMLKLVGRALYDVLFR
ncbi:MAG: NAD(P)/FAD-dependent oxidoreductase [Sulfolobales archaeon]|nr:NAD(P)/FAD-dependent oxidoreductase [Sulfolobales archaeon]